MIDHNSEGRRQGSSEPSLISDELQVEGTAVPSILSSPEAHELTSAQPSPTENLLEELPGLAFRFGKRMFDILASIVGLTLFALMLPLLTLIIKLDSPGPVFYDQERVGINRRRQRRNPDDNERRKVLQPGRPFAIYKLRTMSTNAEANGPQWANQGDSRITRVGRFLRRTRLDELPQFWNVLRGDMSLIGPRPERLYFIRQLEKDVPNYHDRLLVKPGLTGLAQVRNGYDSTVESVCRKVEFDRQYIRRCGPLTEAGILLETVRVVVKGEGAC